MTLDADLNKVTQTIMCCYTFNLYSLSLLSKFHFIWTFITDTCQLVYKQNILKFNDLENNTMDQVQKVILASNLCFSPIPLQNRF